MYRWHGVPGVRPPVHVPVAGRTGVRLPVHVPVACRTLGEATSKCSAPVARRILGEATGWEASCCVLGEAPCRVRGIEERERERENRAGKLFERSLSP